MNKLNIPEFNAEASLYKKSKPYVVDGTRQITQLGTQVCPQILRGATGPFGPIGFPGQDCSGACWHVCMTVGGGADCIAHCKDTCTSLGFTARQ